MLSVDKATGNIGLAGYTADGTNELGVKVTNILFDRKAASIKALFNKAAPGDDASFGFETNYSPRRSSGFSATTIFTIKVSPDGSGFTVAISIDKTAGAVTVAALTATGAVGVVSGERQRRNLAHRHGLGHHQPGRCRRDEQRQCRSDYRGDWTLHDPHSDRCAHPLAGKCQRCDLADRNRDGDDFACGCSHDQSDGGQRDKQLQHRRETASTVRGTTISATTALSEERNSGRCRAKDRMGAATGTATRTTFVTGSVTLPQLAERVKALIDDLITHGLIGA